MADPTRGITSPDTRKVVRAALAGGWEWAGYTGTTHARMVWPKTGEHLSFGTTPSVASWKSLATDIQRVSGVTVWRKGNRKRSRKAADVSGFDLDAARRESRSWHDTFGEHVANAEARRVDAIAEMRRLAAASRPDIRAMGLLLAQVRRAEDELARFNQPVDPFDPNELGGAA